MRPKPSIECIYPRIEHIPSFSHVYTTSFTSRILLPTMRSQIIGSEVKDINTVYQAIEHAPSVPPPSVPPSHAETSCPVCLEDKESHIRSSTVSTICIVRPVLQLCEDVTLGPEGFYTVWISLADLC